jgi:hypothetical protein
MIDRPSSALKVVDICTSRAAIRFRRQAAMNAKRAAPKSRPIADPSLV